MNLTEYLQSLDRGAECLDRFAAKNFDVSVTSVLDRGVSEQHWPDPQPVKSVLSDVEELPLAIIPDPLSTPAIGGVRYFLVGSVAGAEVRTGREMRDGGLRGRPTGGLPGCQ